MSESFKLNWGLWLEATPHGVSQGVLSEGQRGILLEERGNLAIRVLREGLVTPYWYARSFWQPFDEEKREEWEKDVV